MQLQLTENIYRLKETETFKGVGADTFLAKKLVSPKTITPHEIVRFRNFFLFERLYADRIGL